MMRIAFVLLLGGLLGTPLLAASVKVEKVAYKGWPNCYRMTNGDIELIVTSDVGPRVIRLAFVGGDNEFKENENEIGKTGGTEWRAYGGHRLWHAPEAMPRTYAPDNSPIELAVQGDRIRMIQATEPTTGIQKEIDIRMASDGPYVEVVHHLTNKNLWDVELAAWALTVMHPGGRAIIPAPPRGTHDEFLAPTHSWTLWAYTDMSDPRWGLGNKYITLRQDAKATTPQKIGVMVSEGWGAYARNGHLFVKQFKYVNGATYPDFGCSLETFTNADMLELESVGPMVKLGPGASLEHTERWSLYKDVKLDKFDDGALDRVVLPLIRKSQ